MTSRLEIVHERNKTIYLHRLVVDESIDGNVRSSIVGLISLTTKLRPFCTNREDNQVNSWRNEAVFTSKQL